MAEEAESRLVEASGLFDRTKLKALASEISEVMFDWQETSTMERQIDARLLERVSRILHRCEERPDQIREAEDIMMHMDEPDLGVALLRQVFLVRSEPTEQCVVRQLVRLAQSRDSKTFDLTRDALREAAHSEVQRLQNIGCQALFQSNLLSDSELRAFAQSEEIQFRHRIEAVRYLVKGQSSLAPSSLVDVVKSWGSFQEDERRKSEISLREVARSFESFATLDRESVEEIIDELFTEVDGWGLSNEQKKFIQTAMAALPERAIEYLETLGTEHLGSPAVIFSLGTCARRTPLATKALLEHGGHLQESTAGGRSRGLRWIAEQLKRARHDNDPSLHGQLKDLIESVQYDSSLSDADQVLAQLQDVQESWQQGTQRRDLATLLRAIAIGFEIYPEVDEGDAWDLRYEFERGRKPASLSATEREVLVQAMDKTAERYQWSSSASWLVQQYPHFEGYGRTVVQNALGYVALREKADVETNLFRRIRQFFEDQVQYGSSVAEQQQAGEWLDRLVGEKPPGAPQG